eukprot:jgi/Mesvir1/23854/Mv25229-RA.1
MSSCLKVQRLRSMIVRAGDGHERRWWEFNVDGNTPKLV